MKICICCRRAPATTFKVVQAGRKMHLCQSCKDRKRPSGFATLPSQVGKVRAWHR